MHKGHIIKRVLKELGTNKSQLAKKLGKSRPWLYQQLERPNVPLDVIIEIGKIIHYDFSKDFKQLKSYSTETENTLADDTNADYWKQKYILLLEEYNRLLKTKKK